MAPPKSTTQKRKGVSLAAIREKSAKEVSSEQASPSKRKRVSLKALREKQTKRSVLQSYIGELCSNVHYKETKESREVISGSKKEVFFRGSVTDYYHGQVHSVSQYSFVNVCDSTGAIRLCLGNVKSGIQKLGLPDEEKGITSLCYFIANFQGDLSWRPDQNDSSEPSFFLSGTVDSIKENPRSLLSTGIFATSEVLFWLAKLNLFGLRQGDKGKNVTTAFVGRIDMVDASSNTITLAIEDSVGTVMLDICDLQDADIFAKENKLLKGNFISLSGEIRILDFCEEDDGSGSVILKLSAAKGDVYDCFLSDKHYQECTDTLMRLKKRDPNIFRWAVPEDLSPIESGDAE